MAGSYAVPRKLLVNGASVFAGEAITRTATLLVAVLIARRFGPTALGQYGYALALASVLLVVPDLGMHLFVVRELSTNPSRLNSVFWNVHRLKFVLSALLVIFAVAFGQSRIAGDDGRVLFYLLVGRILLQTFSQASMAVFKAFERMQYIAIQQTINSVVVVGWIAVAAAVHAALPFLVFALVAGQLAETVAGWLLVRARFSPGPVLSSGFLASCTLLGLCLPIGATTFLETLNIRVDILVLGVYASKQVVGQFQAAAWFSVGTFLAASLSMTVLFPKLSRLLCGRSVQSSAYVASLLKNSLLLTAAGALAVWFCAPGLIALLVGSEAPTAAKILRILVPSLPLVCLNTALFHIFIAAGRRFVCVGILGFGIFIGAVISFYLTARFGAPGCAFAGVAREFLISAAYLYFLAEGDHARIAGTALLKVLGGATAVLVPAVVLISPFHQEQWLAMWIFLVLGGTLLVLGLPRRGELRLLMDDGL